jgi:two-component system sensor histidine kinase YesM
MFVILLLLFASFLITIIFYYKSVVVPSIKTRKIIKQFNQGLTFDSVFDLKVCMFPEMEQMLNTIQKLLDKKQQINNIKRHSEYLALQNQINPHFLYNTLESIRGEAIDRGAVQIAKMTEALAIFFRYTISNINNLVTLEDEMTNVENYFIIQHYRFGDKLNIKFNYENADIFDFKLPKLTLQPIVENAIYHGLECKVDPGTIDVNLQVTKSRLIINVIDDGVGIEEKILEGLIFRLNLSSVYDEKDHNESKGGIALINVNNRIKLLFGEQYGVTITSALGFGTNVEITLPLIKK